MDIIGPGVDRESECEAVLRTLPEWFGIEPALLMYARDSVTMPTFALVEEGAMLGFLTLQEHFANAWEIHCVAIRAESRHQGHGSRLLSHAEAWLLATESATCRSRLSRQQAPVLPTPRHGSSMPGAVSSPSRSSPRCGTHITRHYCASRCWMWSNPAIERTFERQLRALRAAAHVER